MNNTWTSQNWVIAIILITIFPAVSLAAGTLNRYEASSLDTGTAFEQRVFTARLYEPGTYELVVISVDAENRRHLDIYRMGEGGFEPFVYLGFELPEGLIAVDKLSVHGLDQIVFLTGNGVEAWNPSTENFNLLVTSTSAYKTPVWRSLPRIQLVKDINEDGLEDLMIPDFEGYHIFLQRKSEGKGGIEFDRVTLPIAEVMDIYYGNNPAYHFRGYYSGDYNLDGLKDVWFWDGRQFVIYLQNQKGTFAGDFRYYKPPMELDFETASRISYGSRDQKRATKFLYNLEDMNNDGITDLTTLVVDSRGLFDKTTTYDLHLGRESAGKIEFISEPDSSIRSKGFQFNLTEKDFDGDGQKDVELATVQIGIGKVIGALITGSVGLDIEFFRLAEGQFPEEATVTRRVKAEINFSTGKVFYPSVLTRDLDSDGHPDLLLQHKRDRVRIYRGTGNAQLFSRKAVEVDLNTDTEPVFLEPVDLNKDGVKDLVVRYQGEKVGESYQRRVKTVIFGK